MTQQSVKAGFLIPLPLVWVTALGLVACGLGGFAILDNNEGLYAEISREMLASRDWRHWIIPHLNGLPYLEKPPLLYWLTALSFAVFGQAEWAARMVPAASALACVALLLNFGVAAGRPQAGRMAALMFVSGVGVNVMSHVLMFDMLLTALLSAALMWAYRFTVDRRPRSARLACAFLAFALLVKGFVALILFVLVLGVFIALHRRSARAVGETLKNWCEPGAWAIFLAIALPWHLVASMAEPVFPWLYFVNEQALRFLGRREPYDYYGGAWWYYLPRMVIYLFPWSFLLAGLPFAARRAGGGDRSLKLFLAAAWLVPLLFFSISSAKANYYLIAVMPFAAFHLALEVEESMPLREWRRALPAALIALLALAAAFAVAQQPDRAGVGAPFWGTTPSLAAAWFCAGLAALAVSAVVAAWRRPEAGVAGYLGVSVYTAVALAVALPRIEPSLSTRSLVAYLERELGGRKVFLYRDFEERSSLPFYLKRMVPVIESRSNDLFWGNRLKPGEMSISRERFAGIARSEPVAVVLVAARRAEFRNEPFASGLTGEFRIADTIVFFNRAIEPRQ